MVISDFQNFGFLTPKINFFLIHAQKIQKFIDIRKTGICVIELCVSNSCIKLKVNSFILGCEMAQKPIDGNVIF